MTRWLGSFVQDLGYAARSLRKSPGFTAVAALSLALGIGANTAIFSLISALLLRPLPVEDPARLAVVGDPSRVGSLSQGSVRADIFSYPMYRELRDQSRSFSGLLAAGRTGRVTVGRSQTGTEADIVRTRMVSGNYFSVLGVPAFRGRTFTAADDRAPGAAPYVVVSHDYWRSRLGSDPRVLGRALTLNGSPFTIVGVLPPGFSGEVVGTATEVWIPVAMQAQIHRGRPSLDRWDTSWLQLMGRLKPGVTIGQARAEVNGIFARALDARAGSAIPPEQMPDPEDRVVPVTSGAAGLSRLRSQFSRSLFTLMAIVGLVLLVACANVANLLLERAAGRRKEIGVRLALGAGRRRLIRQLLTESLLLSALGGALGVLFANWAAAALLRLVGGSGKIALDLHPDLTVLGFTLLVSLATGILFGLAPALRATRLELAPVLKEGSRNVAGSSARWPLGKLLVVSQFGFSLLLLVGAGLFVRTLQNLERLDLGFDREALLMLNVDPVAVGYGDERLESFTGSLFDRLRALPGVEGVTASENGIFSGTESATTLRLEGFTPTGGDDLVANFDQVAPDYFAVVGIPLRRGRGLAAGDRRGAPRVAVVNQALAETYFKGRDPVGRKLTVLGPPDQVYEIVGVAADARDHDLHGVVEPRFYLPMLQGDAFPSQYNVEIRTARPAALKEAVRKAVKELDPSLPIDDLDPLTAMIADSIQEERMIAKLSAFFGLLALLLAAIGLYGVVSYAVTRRAGELGIRMALGADRATVLRMVLQETLLLALAGIALGVPAALAAARLVASRLVGLSAADPATLAAATAALLMVALAAGTVPGLRATRVDPVRSLRNE